MSEVADWLKANRIVHAMAGPVSCYVFTPPPRLGEAYGAAIFAPGQQGREAARSMRSVGWAVRLTADPDEAIRWLMGRGYGLTGDGSPVLHLPGGFRTFGTSGIDLVRLVEEIVKDPAATTRQLAKRISASHGREIGREAINRAMHAVGWGTDQRESFRAGDVGPPTVGAA